MTAEQLAEWVHDARRRTLELVSDFSPDQLMGPQLQIVNPPLWEIGHHAWFQSFWALRHAAGQGPVRDDEDLLYDSIAIAHSTRWDLPLPSYEETLEYVLEVRDRVLKRLASPDLSDDEGYHVFYSVLHEDMHTEALTYTRQTLQYSAPSLADLPTLEGSADAGPLPGEVKIPAADFLLGSTPADGFVFDNEKWAHPVRIEPFAIALAPVTQAEFAEFVDAGGYGKQEFWDAQGWGWRGQHQAEHPVYWKRGEDGWLCRHFDRWHSLEPHLPVAHVNWFEAQAYCRWAGRRLPSEAEWELAAKGPDAVDRVEGGRLERRFPWGDEPPNPAVANVDWLAMGCVDVAAMRAGESGFGCRQMIGNVWEWTDSSFGPFPGFVPDHYKEYSEPWFADGRKVLRGGSWATRSRLIRTNYRNFFTPERRDVLAGFRTCSTAA